MEAGTYILNNSMTSKEIILILREGMEEKDVEE